MHPCGINPHLLNNLIRPLNERLQDFYFILQWYEIAWTLPWVIIIHNRRSRFNAGFNNEYEIVHDLYIKFILFINWKDCCWQLCCNISFYNIFMFEYVHSKISADNEFSFSERVYNLHLYSAYNEVNGMKTSKKYVSMYFS